jgi:hypothetical protein
MIDEEGMPLDSIEAEFTKERIFLKEGHRLGVKSIPYEWGRHQMGDDNKLVFHFFVGKGRPVQELLNAFQHFSGNHPNCEWGYTEEMDGHDLILHHVETWKMPAVKRLVIGVIHSWLKE